MVVGKGGFNQLIQAIEGDKTINYSYNGDGLRISKTVNGAITNHIWDGANMVAETDGSNNITAKYIMGIGLIAEDFNGQGRKYALFNGHGDVTSLTDASGNVIKNYDYDAFGNEKNPDVNDANPFRYSSEYFDRETGSIYLRARYYSPGIGRFTTEDTVRSQFVELPNGVKVEDSLSLNLYTYCINNPIMFKDPTGHVNNPDCFTGTHDNYYSFYSYLMRDADGRDTISGTIGRGFDFLTNGLLGAELGGIKGFILGMLEDKGGLFSAKAIISANASELRGIAENQLGAYAYIITDSTERANVITKMRNTISRYQDAIKEKEWILSQSTSALSEAYRKLNVAIAANDKTQENNVRGSINYINTKVNSLNEEIDYYNSIINDCNEIITINTDYGVKERQ